MTKLIGISGKPGSNKMFYAFRIIRELRFRNQNTILVSLAEPLYKEANAIANDVVDRISSETIIETYNLGEKGHELIELLDVNKIGERNPIYGYSRRNENFRKALVMLGTNIRRAQDENYFINKLYETLPDSADFAVFLDLRFPNEAEYVTINGGMTLRVNINEPEFNAGGYKYEAGLKDEVETALDDYYLFHYEFYRELFNGSSFGFELEEFFGLSAIQQ